MSTTPDILGMSDEEFAKMAVPPEAAPVTPAMETPPPTTETPTEETNPEETPETPPADEETPEGEKTPNEEKESKEEKPAEEPAPEDPPAPAKKDPETPPEPEAKETKEEQPAKTEPDYEAFYKLVMAPFKANGKLIQLNSAEEVIRLMQMGANYTKKMQAIQEHKKYLMMLQNNGLLDENKLSFYIDLHHKNPEAIKKFLKEANIDPVDVDTSSEVNYKSGAHAVTDQEVSLQSAIEEVNSLPGGKETIQSVNAWDQASKRALWDNPELLSVIHAQRENGIYAKITAEMERRRILGQVGPNVPFLVAYKQIGDELAAKGLLGANPAPSTQPTVGAKTPVTVRPAKSPSTKPADNSKVRAAAAPRTVSRPAKTVINPLAMADDEFLKQFANKV